MKCFICCQWLSKSTKSWYWACSELLSTSIPGQQLPPFCAGNPSPSPWFPLSLGTGRMWLFWTPVQLLRLETHLRSTQLAKVSERLLQCRPDGSQQLKWEGELLVRQGERFETLNICTSLLSGLRDPTETCTLWSNSRELGRTFRI